MSQTPIIAELQAANKVWRDGILQKDPGFFKRSADTKQAPGILWIGCADSRVPESVVLAQLPGQLFVHRNIANQFHLNDDSALSVLTYAVEDLHVKHVIIAGHTHCGGCKGAWEVCAKPPNPPPDENLPLIRWLTPLVKLADSLGLASKPKDEAIDILVRKSVEVQVENVVNTKIIQQAWTGEDKKDVRIHGCVYELRTGELTDLGVTRKAPWAPE